MQTKHILKESLGVRSTQIAKRIAWGLLFLTFVVGLFFFAHRAKVSLTEIEYSGQIVEKWVSYSHTQQGSFPRFWVLVETEAGQKLTVALDRENYERAKPGMRVRKTKRKGFELARVEPASPTGSSTKTHLETAAQV